MGIMALIVGLLGAICGIVGILEAVEIMPDTGYAAMTWQFWFLLAGVLFLATISLLQSGRGGGYDD